MNMPTAYEQRNSLIPIADEQIVFDLAAGSMAVNGQPVHLSPRVFEVASFFVKRADIVQPAEDAAIDIWGEANPATQASVQVHINVLRSSFGDRSLSDPWQGALQTYGDYGYVAVTSIKQASHIWNPDKHDIREIYAGKLDMNETSRTIRVDGQRIAHFTPLEFALFEYIATNQGLILSRERLLARMFEHGSVANDKLLYTCIASLRRKMAPELGSGRKSALTYGHDGYQLKKRLQTAG